MNCNNLKVYLSHIDEYYVSCKEIYGKVIDKSIGSQGEILIKNKRFGYSKHGSGIFLESLDHGWQIDFDFISIQEDIIELEIFKIKNSIELSQSDQYIGACIEKYFGKNRYEAIGNGKYSILMN